MDAAKWQGSEPFDIVCLVIVAIVFGVTAIRVHRILSVQEDSNKPELPCLPSVSVGSLSMTVQGIASNTQVRADMEVVFDLVEDKNPINNYTVF